MSQSQVDYEEEQETSVILTEFNPPSVPLPVAFKSASHYSEIPKFVRENPNASVTLGVDEAGRGPVLGPMVYGIGYCLTDYEQTLKKYGFADSKTLTEDKRTSLMKEIVAFDVDEDDEEGNELKNNLGWATMSLTSRDISSGMLKPSSIGNYNLNEQAHDATMDLIAHVLKQGVNIREIYVDTVGPPATYQKKLSERFPGIKIVVAKKADALYPSVSAASIVAKVTRDYSLFHTKAALGFSDDLQWGSGYPSDPKTQRWLHGNVDPVFGWQNVVRFSWRTAADSIKDHGGVEVVWEDDIPIKEDYISSYFDGSSSNKNKEKVSSRWFVENVVS